MGLEALQLHQRLGGMQQVGCATHSGSTFYTWIELQLKTGKGTLASIGWPSSAGQKLTSARGGLASRASLAICITKLRRSKTDIGQRRTGIASVTRYIHHQAQQDLVTMQNDCAAYERICQFQIYMLRQPLRVMTTRDAQPVLSKCSTQSRRRVHDQCADSAQWSNAHVH